MRQININHFTVNHFCFVFVSRIAKVSSFGMNSIYSTILLPVCSSCYLLDLQTSLAYVSATVWEGRGNSKNIFFRAFLWSSNQNSVLTDPTIIVTMQYLVIIIMYFFNVFLVSTFLSYFQSLPCHYSFTYLSTKYLSIFSIMIGNQNWVGHSFYLWQASASAPSTYLSTCLLCIWVVDLLLRRKVWNGDANRRP